MAKKKNARGFSGRRSKIDPFADIVGTVSDKEVAAKAGVSPENVRTWRKRRGIPATWRGEGDAAPTAAAALKAETAKPKRRKGKPKRRKSKLDPYRKQLGVLPDKEISELSGTSVENVRAYRKRHKIAAKWQQAAAEAPAPKAKKAPAKSAPAAKPAKPPRRKASPRNWAFRITADVGGDTKEYVTFGADVVEAARVAKERLGASHSDAFVQKIEVLGVAL